MQLKILAQAKSAALSHLHCPFSFLEKHTGNPGCQNKLRTEMRHKVAATALASPARLSLLLAWRVFRRAGCPLAGL